MGAISENNLSRRASKSREIRRMNVFTLLLMSRGPASAGVLRKKESENLGMELNARWRHGNIIVSIVCDLAPLTFDTSVAWIFACDFRALDENFATITNSESTNSAKTIHARSNVRRQRCKQKKNLPKKNVRRRKNKSFRTKLTFRITKSISYCLLLFVIVCVRSVETAAHKSSRYSLFCFEWEKKKENKSQNFFARKKGGGVNYWQRTLEGDAISMIVHEIDQV